MHTWRLMLAGLWLAVAATAAWAEPNKDAAPPNAPEAKPDRPRDGEPRQGRPFGERRRMQAQRDSDAEPADDDGGPADGPNRQESRRQAGKPGEGPGGFGGPGPFGEMAKERIEAAMKFLKEHYPPMYERLQKLREQDPRGFQRQIFRIIPRLPEFMDMLETNPELAKMMMEEHRLEMEIRDEVFKHSRANSDDLKTRSKQRIQELVSKQFDIRQNRLKATITDLERQLEQKKRALEERASRKDQIIELELQKRMNPDI